MMFSFNLLITACVCPSAAVGHQFNSTEELITRMEEMTKELKVEGRKRMPISGPRSV